MTPHPSPHQTSPRQVPPQLGHPRPGALIWETGAAALSRPVPTIVVALVTALVCATVMLTTGRAVRAEQEVVSRLDQLGTQLIAVSDNNGSGGMKAASVATLDTLTGVEWVFALGAAEEGYNARLPVDGTGVATRVFYGEPGRVVSLVSGRWPRAGEAIASVEAAASLRLLNGTGGVGFGAVSPDTYPIVGTYQADQALRSLTTSVLVMPSAPDWGTDPVLYIYAKALDSASVDQVVENLPRVAVATQPELLTVESPQALRETRDQISSDLAASSRYLMLATLATGLILVAVTMLAAVTDRKNDFGRRRALGATRSAIMVMVVLQALIAGLSGTLLGVGTGTVINLATGAAQPSLDFTGGLAVLTILSVVLASLPPAFLASRRDPVRILRIP